MSLFTEALISLYLYILICLTDFATLSEEVRESLALTLVYTIGISIFVNFIVLGHKGTLWFKRWRLRRIRKRTESTFSQRKQPTVAVAPSLLA
jgi:hypothetical protein